MRISWVLSNAGAGEREVTDMDQAALAVTQALREAYSPDALERILTDTWGPLRYRLLTDGQYAVARGESWTGTSPAVMVTLVP